MNMYFSFDTAQALRPLVHPEVWKLVEGIATIENQFGPKAEIIIQKISLNGEFGNFSVATKYLDRTVYLDASLQRGALVIGLSLDDDVPGTYTLFEQNGWKFRARGANFQTDRIDQAIGQLSFALLQVREAYVKEIMS